ncbi:hypothetical protein M1D52_10130 [Olivibacter sp. SA151]|uniref:hypothetical protein n=1 Tax=Olivibacter jilunii TaxID=985016 RepID=UPI003F18878D
MDKTSPLYRVFILLLLLTISLSKSSQASVWQWSVSLKSVVSEETDAPPTAFLWIPPNCKQVRGVVVGMHNMVEEGVMEHNTFRAEMSDLGFAEIWVTPGLDPLFDPNGASQVAFDEMLDSLASVSGYTEIKDAPIVAIGHSAYASFPWNFAAWNPKRTLAILSIHGDAPQTNLTGCGRRNLDWGNRNTNGIPGLMVMGEFEWWEDRLTPAITYKERYPSAPISLLADAGYGHFDYSDHLVGYLALFIRKAAQYRLAKKMKINRATNLKPLDPQEGWLAERWYPDRKPSAKPAGYKAYQGNKKEAFWYFDQQMAEATEAYYAHARGKVDQYLGATTNGKLLPFNEKNHARYTIRVVPTNDQLTFSVGASFTDSARTKIISQHAAGKIDIDPICGSVQKVNDTIFAIRFYRLGVNNAKRSNTFWLKASHPGDKYFKSTVQQIYGTFQYPLNEGKPQHIMFDSLTNINGKVKAISLHARSDSGLPVFYYVKEGPVRIEGNKLYMEKIPLRAKKPMKVTVVAWQYGRAMGEKIQSAPTVERSFYIH